MLSAETIAGTVLGVLGGAAVSHLYFWLSGRDLEGKVGRLESLSNKLQRSINVVGRALHDAGHVVCHFDDKGNVIEVNVATAHLTLRGISSQATGTVGPVPVYDRQGENPDPRPAPG